ncbi:MAG: hypothetical protein ABI700_25615 [Chloroflexota bacterium]
MVAWNFTPESETLWMANIRTVHFTPLAQRPIHFCGSDYLQIGYAGSTAVFKNLPPNPIVVESISEKVFLLNGIEIAAGHDLQAKMPRWFFNSTLEKLMQSLKTYSENLPRLQAHHDYVAEREKSLTGLHDAPLAAAIKELRQHGQRTYDEVRPQLEAIDPAAFDSSTAPYVWPDTLLEIRWSSPISSAD